MYLIIHPYSISLIIYSIDAKAPSSVFSYPNINQMPETIWIINTTDAKAPNMYQKLTFLGTGCLDK
jgi:hypothetical protein